MAEKVVVLSVVAVVVIIGLELLLWGLEGYRRQVPDASKCWVEEVVMLAAEAVVAHSGRVVCAAGCGPTPNSVYSPGDLDQ